MKRLIATFSIFALLITFSSDVFAQDNTIDASATVLNNIDYIADRAVDFGNIQPDLSPQPELDLANNSTSGVEGEAVQFGYLVFSGSSGQTVSVSFAGGNGQDSQETLTSSSSDNSDEITYGIEVAEEAGDNSSGDPSSANSFESNSTIELTDDSGDHTLWVGGTLSSDNTPLTSGTYSGTVVFTIDYSFQ